jgi:hypothetical protein
MGKQNLPCGTHCHKALIELLHAFPVLPHRVHYELLLLTPTSVKLRGRKQSACDALHRQNVTYAESVETRPDLVLCHHKRHVSGMILKVGRIEHLQLRHGSNDFLQSLECLVACADQ